MISNHRKSLNALALFIMKQKFLHLWATPFSNLIYSEAFPDAHYLEHVIFFGVAKNGDGLVPLMASEREKLLVEYHDAEKNEDVEPGLTMQEFCEVAMRDTELSGVIAIVKATTTELGKDEVVYYCVGADAFRAMLRPRQDEVKPRTLHQLIYDEDAEVEG